MIEFLIWLSFSSILMALSEYWIHRVLMHKRFFRSERLNWVWFNHAVLHHKKGDNSHNVDLSIWHHLILGGPLLILLGWFRPIGALALLLVFIHHSYIWTHAHRAIHGLENNWLQRFSFYKRMKLHHEKHHEKTNRNYGVVYMWPDRLFGTKI